jgi:hypothetical protein
LTRATAKTYKSNPLGLFLLLRLVVDIAVHFLIRCAIGLFNVLGDWLMRWRSVLHGSIVAGHPK